jgi:hypothetical protein
MASDTWTGTFALGGTALGLLGSFGLNAWSAKREQRLKKRVALRIVLGELELVRAIYRTSATRGVWWPEDYAPPSEAWTRYADEMARVLDDQPELWFRTSWAYTMVETNIIQRRGKHPALGPDASRVVASGVLLDGVISALQKIHGPTGLPSDVTL